MTTIINPVATDWPDGLTWGLSGGSTEFLVFTESERCNIWGKSTILWLEWQGSAANSPLEGLRPKRFVLPLEYLT